MPPCRVQASSRRRIMFSSFDPDVCAALRARQARAAVLFLSDGVVRHVDPRRNSVAAAVDHALRHQLQVRHPFCAPIPCPHADVHSPPHAWWCRAVLCGTAMLHVTAHSSRCHSADSRYSQRSLSIWRPRSMVGHLDSVLRCLEQWSSVQRAGCAGGSAGDGRPPQPAWRRRCCAPPGPSAHDLR